MIPSSSQRVSPSEANNPRSAIRLSSINQVSHKFVYFFGRPTVVRGIRTDLIVLAPSLVQLVVDSLSTATDPAHPPFAPDSPFAA